MSRFIEFTTDPSLDPDISRFALGNPLHDGVIPPARIDVSGVRVDGSVVDFVDAETPDRLHRALVEAKRLQERMIVIDCLAFTALMAGVNLSTLPNQSGTKFPSVERNYYARERGPSPTPLYLIRRDGDAMSYVHAMYPAHTVNGEAYLHKLGAGPVAMSNLVDASTMYGSRTADAMPEVKYETKSYDSHLV